MKSSRIIAATFCCLALGMSAAGIASAAENSDKDYAWEQNIEDTPVLRGMYRSVTGGEIYQYQYDRAFSSQTK